MISGGPLEAFRGGWGVAPFVGRGLLAHFWNRPWAEHLGGRQVYARCGVSTLITERVPMLGKGDAPECKRCQRILVREHQ